MTLRSVRQLSSTTPSSTACRRSISARKHLCSSRVSARRDEADGPSHVGVARRSPHSRLQPRYRRLRDIETPRYVGLRLATAKALQGFCPLVWRESSRTAEAHATGFGTGSAVAGTGTNQLSFKLGQATEYSQHQTTMRRSCIGPSVLETAEASPPLADGG